MFSVSPSSPEAPMPEPQQAEQPAKKDTTARYPVKKTQITSQEDLGKKGPIDLKDPSNVKTEVEYDLKNNIYLFKTKVGDDILVTPFSLSVDEYMDYSLKKSMAEYFRSKNEEAVEKKDQKEDFSLKDIKINLGPAEKIFGPGGVRIKTQGYTEISMGMKHTNTKSPTLSENKRSRLMFDFDQKIQLNVNASVGDKVNFGMNYDTESTFDFDSKKLKLAYEGKEDEIVKHLEAGNVSMSTTNSLINGGAALFGIKADLQFGKLRVSTVLSQQESESQTVSSKGGVQTTPFELTADQYDANKHFFLGHYFRETYDRAMSKFPIINSNIKIEKLEVWVTNKRGNFDNARNIIALADLAEHDSIKNNTWSATSTRYPDNNANTMYDALKTTYKQARDISRVTDVFGGIPNFESELDYEKVESARMLESSEYTYNAQLGYISLRSTLQPDEVLAVAYTYSIGRDKYQVGELASNIVDKYDPSNDKSGALFLKLLKPVSISPNSYTWDLMMKNVYNLGAYQIQQDKFRLNISYQSDTTGTYINYIPEGKIKDKLLLRVMNLDRLDSRGNVVKNGSVEGDGIFDFVEGLTVISQNGRIIFPVIEPFGSHLAKQIDDPAIAKKYVYQELYDMSITDAVQIAEKNKFKISGQYRASSGNELDLGATNVAKGSVRVTAGGITLQEGSQYTVDYISGKVIIIDQSIIDAGTAISVSLENQAMFSMQRKTMMGLNLSYDFTKDFNVGATIMHMYEKPLTVKTQIGNESLKNTVWGLNTSYKTQSQWLTNMIDKLPFVNATQPSSISLNAEFAHMIPGHYENKYGGGYSYLDDFETAKSRISMTDVYAWKLASTPLNKKGGTETLFPEAELSDNLDYGKNRALLAWYNIDRLFTLRSSSLTPQHIKNDKEQLSNHYVREVGMGEVYPNKQTLYNETSTLTTFNLSFYPNERGPYNLDPNINPDGSLTSPEKRWGGIMRKINNTDFEANNIEYLEFWLMDPFVYDKTDLNYNGGDLYFNIGNVSEDILKDGKKFYENGLPLNNDTTAYTYTVWGKVPTRQSTTYAFNSDLSEADRRRQDVGLNGLSSAEELEFKAYKEYIAAIKQNSISDDALQRVLADPAADNYHYFRGADYDRDEVSILDRYKYYNNTEGNSLSTDSKISTAANTNPDVEDINQDYTMNETEAYFQYKVRLNPREMEIGSNYIADKREVEVTLRNDKKEKITWYQFKIPLRDKSNTDMSTIGTIQDFKNIRFMRMFLTKFDRPVFLRFGSLEFLRGEWRVYSHALNPDVPVGNGTLNVSTVNIEENGDKEPVNYVLPPDVSRVLDPSQPQLRQENEQSLSLQVMDLQQDASRAVYKNTNYDLRRYKRIQMYAHAEEVVNKESIAKGELMIFLRLGSDYKNNYYEYEIPLTITPPGEYGNSQSQRAIVWPKENMFDFPLELLKNIKLDRNKKKRQGMPGVSFTEKHTGHDPENKNNQVAVVGNPSLSEIKVMMIGIRNNSNNSKSAEIWVNELRLTDFDEEGGWAAQVNMNVALSDIGNVSVMGRKETAGFGSLDQSLMERRADDFSMYTVATNLDLGRFVPEKAKLSIPFYYSYSNQTVSPKYDPLDQDVTLKEALAVVETKQEKDSIRNLSEDKVVSKNLSFSGVKLNIKSKTPMPYDPANFSFGYSFSETKTTNPTTVYDVVKDYRANVSYSYSPLMKSWTPFKDSNSKSAASKFTKALSFNYLPSNISFNSQMSRLYSETVIRDLESYSLGGDNRNNQYTSWSQDFYWDRDLSIAWDFTRNLKASFSSGTRAEIEEPYMAVNKDIVGKDRYQNWKDSVRSSILSLGRPLSYRQNMKLTYTLPFNTIPVLDWITSTANYESNYRWDRGAESEPGYELGNTINNDLTLGINSRFNLVSLYNKSSFLKEVNQKFEQSRRGNQRPNTAKRPPTKKKKYEGQIQLADSAVIATHNLNTKNIRITAKVNDRVYPIKFKQIDKNKIRILTKDSVQVALTVTEGPDPTEGTWYKVAQYAARGVMSVRSVSINISSRNETYLPGFKPAVGDAFGQKNSEYGLSPGLGFAFGLQGGEDFVYKALSNDWLLQSSLDSTSTMNISPAVYNSSSKVDVRAELEPIKGLKISLSALREKSDRTDFQFMYTGVPKTFGGSFAISTIALSTAFQGGKAENDYASAVFDKFLDSRDIIANRLENSYRGIRYPAPGYPEYDPAIHPGVNKNSPDVLIPAFLAAYTGKDPKKVSTSFFPALTSMLPNWNIAYEGLINMPWIKDKFKSLKLSHSYVAQYRVGSFSSHLDWMPVGNDGLGYVSNPVDGNYTPSSAYDISSVSITEAFNPLFGAEGTLNNSMTVRAKYNKARTLNLNMSAYQIVEALRNELVIGMGYKINDFNRVLGITSKSAKGFNNDLNINVDISYSSNNTLIRKIEERFTQATSGTKILSLKASADYSLSKSLTLKAYFDRIMNTPLLSSSSYPTTNTDFGISLRFTLSE